MTGSDEVLQRMGQVGGNRGCCGWGRITNQTWEIGQGMFEQRHEEQEGVSQGIIRAGCSRQRYNSCSCKGQTLRSSVPAVFHKEYNSPVTKGAEEGAEGREVTGQSLEFSAPLEAYTE